jgi:hypothetical protein
MRGAVQQICLFFDITSAPPFTRHYAADVITRACPPMSVAHERSGAPRAPQAQRVRRSPDTAFARRGAFRPQTPSATLAGQKRHGRARLYQRGADAPGFA